MKNKPIKVFDNPKNGYAEYEFACRGRNYYIEEWSGKFTTYEDDGEQHVYREESVSLEDAIAKINYANKPKGPFQIAPQIPSKSSKK